MLIECGISLYAAVTNHSPALLAFGSDSLVELLSASVVLLPYFTPRILSERAAGRIAAALLVVLAAVVGFTSILSLSLHFKPEVSCSGIGVTIAALVVMPLLAHLKRTEARRTANVALAADAMQSATCAYLAFITLVGLAANAAFHLPRVDACAALVALPILLREAYAAWQGHACTCC